jgi:hypothetical protein
MLLCHCRGAFEHVLDRSLALVEYLKAQGAAAVHNMDNLLLRESMDVIGKPSIHSFFHPSTHHAFQSEDHGRCSKRLQKTHGSLPACSVLRVPAHEKPPRAWHEACQHA